MLAHAASAQGISAVENMCGREHVLDHSTVPAACFTHPEVPLPIRGDPISRTRYSHTPYPIPVTQASIHLQVQQTRQQMIDASAVHVFILQKLHGDRTCASVCRTRVPTPTLQTQFFAFFHSNAACSAADSKTGLHIRQACPPTRVAHFLISVIRPSGGLVFVGLVR